MRRPVSFFILFIFGSTAAAAQRLPPADSMGFSKRLPVVPSNYYTRNLGFFCKKEWQLQKQTNVNLFFRLGSKEYVDYLERKPNARRF